MAYGKRLQIEYKDINDIDTRIEVWQEGFVGAATVREYASGNIACNVKWGDKSSKQYPLVYGSKVTFYFDSETNFEFHDFFTSNSRKNKIYVYKNEVLFHISYGEADTWSEPYSFPPYEVSFSGYDGLGLLKDEDFLDENKDYYEGEMTPIEILQLVLSKTGIDLPLNTAISIRPDGELASEDALTQVTKDLVTYREMSCYEVLESLFRGARIYQRAGEWWCISNDKWENDQISCYAYTAAGVANGTKIIDTKFSGFWIEGDGDLSFLPALKQMKIVQDYGFKPNIIVNPDFNNENGSIDGWETYGTAPESRLLDADGNRFIYLPGKEAIGDPAHAWQTLPRTWYMRTLPMRVEQTLSIPTLSVDYALMGADSKMAHMFVGVHLVGDSNTHYNLRAVLNDDEDKIIYEWEETSLLKGVPVSDEIYSWKPLFSGREYTVHSSPIESYPFDEVPDNFKSKSIQIKDGIPEGGDLRIYLFLADSTKVEIAGSCWKNIRLKFSDEEAEDLPTENELLLINNAGNNYVPEEVKLPNGDYPDLPNKLIIYTGGFKLLDGSASSVWKVDGYANTYSYAEIIARFIAAEMRLARFTHSQVFADHIPSVSLVFEDVNLNKRFVECGLSYNDRMQTSEGRFVEVVSFNIADFIVGETISYQSSSSSSSSGGKATVINTDELAGLVDNNYTKVNKPGYFLADDFLGFDDPETGRTKLTQTITRSVIEQAAHGFSLKDAIRFDNTTLAYIKAQANNRENAEVVGIVTEVIDADNFAFKHSGLFLNEDFENGLKYYLSPGTAGLIEVIGGAYVWPPGSEKVAVGHGSAQGLIININKERDTTLLDMFVFGEVLTGAVNGVNKTFELASEPQAGSHTLFNKNLPLVRAVDYTIAGTVVTMTRAPIAGSIIWSNYIKKYSV